MRGRNSLGRIAGALLIAAGILLIFALILPAGFWWFMLGLGLIALGIYCIRRR